MKVLKFWHVTLIIILCVAAGVTAHAYREEDSPSPTIAAGPQDVTNLDRRISMLEQRLYTIESSINRLEQQASLNGRTTTAPYTSARDTEVNLLRGQIEVFERRLAEIECGLVKLDERTATAASREARRRTGASSTDPCRAGADAPLRLSSRP